MSLAEEYKRQSGWRDWTTVLDALPLVPDQRVLDLGCGVGDQAAQLASRGALVIGVDQNEELLREARSRHLKNVELRRADLRRPLDLDHSVDGLWCSFTAAYFTDLPRVLSAWRGYLRPGGWIALTEVDDLFGHEPLSSRTKSLLDAYTGESLAAGRYDFHCGRKLAGCLEECGFQISQALTLKDGELCFDGPATADIVDAWRSRFQRMILLREFCGSDFEQVREEFLACLDRDDHRCVASVHSCIATKR